MDVILQDRDYRLMKELTICGFLAFNQIATFFFDGNFETARKRIAKLKNACYISITDLGTVRVIQITDQGLRVFANGERLNLRISRKPVSSPTIKHELAVRSLKLKLSRLPQSDGQVLLKEIVIDQKALCFKVDRKTFRPDVFASIQLQNGHQYCVFLEVDMGTESQPRLMRKIEMYERFRKSGEFARWRLEKVEIDALNGFHVILVINGRKRADILEKKLTQLKKNGMFIVIKAN